MHRVAAEHGVSIGAVDAQPHLAPGVLGQDFSRARLRLTAHRHYFSNTGRAGPVGLGCPV